VTRPLTLTRKPRKCGAGRKADHPKTAPLQAAEGKLTSLRTLGGVRRYYASEAEQLLRDSKQQRRPR
jgi:hypothetical protein